MRRFLRISAERLRGFNFAPGSRQSS